MHACGQNKAGQCLEHSQLDMFPYESPDLMRENTCMTYSVFLIRPNELMQQPFLQAPTFQAYPDPTHIYFEDSPENVCEYFSVFAREFCIEKWRGFLVNFLWYPFPAKRSTKTPQKFGENPERNSGQNPGQKFEKFGELSFCDFSDLTHIDSFRNLSGFRAFGPGRFCVGSG